MKKVIAIFLLLAMVVGLCACDTEGSTSTEAESPISGKFSVGYSRANITPTESVPLGGYGNSSKRLSTGFLDFMYTTCIAMTDAEGNTVLLFHNDLINSHESTMDSARTLISSATGVPYDNIITCATHTHASPDLGNSMDTITRYRNKLIQCMLQAAKGALADRKVAEMYMASGEVYGLNFVRHYELEDGSFCGDNFGIDTGKYKGHTSEADHTMQLLKFVREGGEDVLLVNWQTHPHRYGGSTKYDLTADLVGAMRDEVESNTGVLFAYFTGAAGNINPSSRISSENITSNYLEQGQALGQEAIKIMETFEKVETGKVQVDTAVVTGKIDHSMDELVSTGVCSKIQQVFSETGSASLAAEEARKYGLNSVYHANALIAKAGMGETNDIPISAFSIGDVGFVSAPYEMFDTNGDEIKSASQFKMTFVLTCSNGSYGYMPSAFAFTHGSYETNTCKYEPGIGEQLAQQFIGLLDQLYSEK